MYIGKTSKKYLQTGMDEYFTRIKHYIKFELIEVADVKIGQKEAVSVLKKKEAEAFLKHISEDDILILLDENGQNLDSVEFAQYIEKQLIKTSKRLIFTIGGAFGFSEEISTRANGKISLSRMTFSHQLIRLIFAEQLYRAFSIIHNEPYHNA